MKNDTNTEIGIGTRVSYEDMANPLREGTITGEVAGQWQVDWDDPEGDLWKVPSFEARTTVTKDMLARADERQQTFRAERRGRCGGWAVERDITPAAYYALCREAEEAGVPVSLDDPASPKTVPALIRALPRHAGQGETVILQLSNTAFHALAAAVEVAYDDPDSTPPIFRDAGAKLWDFFTTADVGTCDACSARLDDAGICTSCAPATN